MPNLETIFSSRECDIFYNKDLQIIQTFWKGVYCNGDTLRKILNDIICALEIKKASIIVADARDMYVMGEEDQAWILSYWYPRAVAAGFRYQGLILNKNSFSELTIKKISKEYDKAVVTTHYFSSPSEAIDWVKEVQEAGNEK